MGIKTVAIYSTADESALHRELATEAYCVGGPLSSDSYLNMENILSIACLTGCDAIHPGFGFLSESPIFASMVEKCGITWIGPNPTVMDQMVLDGKYQQEVRLHIHMKYFPHHHYFEVMR